MEGEVLKIQMEDALERVHQKELKNRNKLMALIDNIKR